MNLQQPVPAPPEPPSLPVPAPTPGRIVTTRISGPFVYDVANLKARRSELSTQIQSATSRRNELAREIRRAEPNSADRAGLEARLQLLDQRIIQLETDLSETGRLLAMAPGLAGTTQPARPPRRGNGGARDIGPLALIMIFMLLVPFVWGAARSLWRRSPGRSAAPVDLESRERLARLETAVDAIAIEMERVAEGQRFVTKLLAEAAAAPPVVAAGDPARREALRVSAERGEG